MKYKVLKGWRRTNAPRIQDGAPNWPLASELASLIRGF